MHDPFPYKKKTKIHRNIHILTLKHRGKLLLILCGQWTAQHEEEIANHLRFRLLKEKTNMTWSPNIILFSFSFHCWKKKKRERERKKWVRPSSFLSSLDLLFFLFVTFVRCVEYMLPCLSFKIKNGCPYTSLLTTVKRYACIKMHSILSPYLVLNKEGTCSGCRH